MVDNATDGSQLAGSQTIEQKSNSSVQWQKLTMPNHGTERQQLADYSINGEIHGVGEVAKQTSQQMNKPHNRIWMRLVLRRVGMFWIK